MTTSPFQIQVSLISIRIISIEIFLAYQCPFYFVRVLSCLQSGDFIQPQVKVGDKVLLPEYGGTKVELEEKEYHLFRETDLLAKLD